MPSTRRPRPTRSHRKRAAGLAAYTPPNGSAQPITAIAPTATAVYVVFPVPLRDADLTAANYEIFDDDDASWKTCDTVANADDFTLQFDTAAVVTPYRWRKKQTATPEEGSQVIVPGATAFILFLA